MYVISYSSLLIKAVIILLYEYMIFIFRFAIMTYADWIEIPPTRVPFVNHHFLFVTGKLEVKDPQSKVEEKFLK